MGCMIENRELKSLNWIAHAFPPVLVRIINNGLANHTYDEKNHQINPIHSSKS